MTKTEILDVEVNVPAARLWNALRDLPTLLPTLLPGVIDSVTWLQGDGSPGSIRVVKFGAATEVASKLKLTASKEVIDEVDTEKHTISYHVVEGEVTTVYSHYKVTTQIQSAEDPAKSIIHYVVEYEPIGEQPPPVEHIHGYAQFLKLLEARLVANQAEYV